MKPTSLQNPNDPNARGPHSFFPSVIKLAICSFSHTLLSKIEAGNILDQADAWSFEFMTGRRIKQMEHDGTDTDG